MLLECVGDQEVGLGGAENENVSQDSTHVMQASCMLLFEQGAVVAEIQPPHTPFAAMLTW